MRQQVYRAEQISKSFNIPVKVFSDTGLLSVWSFCDAFQINGAAHLNSPNPLVQAGRKVPVNDNCKILNSSDICGLGAMIEADLL